MTTTNVVLIPQPAGLVTVSWIGTVQLSATVPTFLNQLLTLENQLDASGATPFVKPIALSSSWMVSIEDEESFGLDNHPVSVVVNAPVLANGVPATIADAWQFMLRWETDINEPTLTVRLYAVFQTFAGPR